MFHVFKCFPCTCSIFLDVCIPAIHTPEVNVHASNFCIMCHVDLMEPATTIEYRVYTQISNSGHGVCVDCLFLVESTEYCVVIIHEKVLCFGVSQCEMNLTNIDASFKIARSGDKGHRCVQNINMTNFQVGVIGGRQVSRLVTATGMMIVLFIMP